ncbi:DUF188 domain-containing protein [Moraxella oculi]|uniref:DUF188 domain-containing protein n=1 Tax=Moraxella oculi TaxID=2940516 RepID=A0ABW8U5L3_9GAMM
MLITNTFIKLPPSLHPAVKIIPQGFDMTNDHIKQHVSARGLVITSDIPLVNDVLIKDTRH